MLMMTRKTIVMAAAAIALSAGCGHAQMNMKDMKPESKPMAMAGDAAATSMDEVLSIYAKQIIDAAEAMPADRYDFAPAQEDFKAGFKVDFVTPKPVMTFAKEVKHIAQTNYYFFAPGNARADADGKAISDLKTKDEIVATLKKSFTYAHKSVTSMTAATAFDPLDVEGGKSTRIASYAFGLAHMGDHYGQMNEYLRMNGIVPPASRR